MGERKVVNKYYPPDFDPAKIPRIIKSENKQIKVRTMLPMSIRCKSCGTFIGKGRKFNSLKENLIGEKYLGIQVFRFYIKCTHCCSEIAIKTDPRNSDYIVESGATRNFEAYDEEKRDNGEIGDVMKDLEDRRLESKREMEVYAGLDEIRSMKSRRSAVGVDKMLDDLQHSASASEKEEETSIKSLFEGSRRKLLRRISDEDVGDGDDDLSLCAVKRRKVQGNLNDDYVKKTNTILKSSAVRISFVKKVAAGNGLQCLCQQYDSDEDN